MSRGHCVETNPTTPIRRPAVTMVARAPQAQVQRAEIREIIRGPAVQPKRAISEPGDASEREADRVADDMMRMYDEPVGNISAAPAQMQRMCQECEDEVQRP